MTVEQIEDALQHAPFDLELDSGTKLTVKHPDFLMFAENRRAVIVTIGDHFYATPVEKIAAIRAAIKGE